MIQYDINVNHRYNATMKYKKFSLRLPIDLYAVIKSCADETKDPLGEPMSMNKWILIHIIDTMHKKFAHLNIYK
jgi:hypothetical protein